jgi:hypothetical protein
VLGCGVKGSDIPKLLKGTAMIKNAKTNSVSSNACKLRSKRGYD